MSSSSTTSSKTVSSKTVSSKTASSKTASSKTASSKTASSATVPTPARRRWLLAARLLGLGVVLVSLRWILLRLGTDGEELASFRPSGVFLTAGALAVPLWAAAGLLPARAWAHLLRVLAVDFAHRERDVAVFARLQISKYLPGHAFQVARHALTRTLQRGTERSVPHTALGAAATCEALGMIAAAAALATVGFAAAVSTGAVALGFPLPSGATTWIPAAALLAVLAGPWLLARLSGSRWLPHVAPHESRALLPAVALYGAEKAVAGLLFGVLLFAVWSGSAGAAHEAAPAAASGAPALGACLLAGVAAYPLAWLVGYLTPMTPAGAGAVEALLVATLGSRYGAVEVLAAAVGLRLVMVAGDALLALGAHLALPVESSGEASRAGLP